MAEHGAGLKSADPPAPVVVVGTPIATEAAGDIPTGAVGFPWELPMCALWVFVVVVVGCVGRELRVRLSRARGTAMYDLVKMEGALANAELDTWHTGSLARAFRIYSRRAGGDIAQNMRQKKKRTKAFVVPRKKMSIPFP